MLMSRKPTKASKKPKISLMAAVMKQPHAYPQATLMPAAANQSAPATSAPAPPKRQRTSGLHPSALSYALSIVAADVYVQIDEQTFSACKPVVVQPCKKRKKAAGCAFATWKPRGSLFFSLVKTSKDTVVFCHANGTAYHAAPPVRLAADCPANTSFLCQWCLDKEADKPGKVPHMLVFDVVEAQACPDVAERGERLRRLARYLPQPMCVIQWAGESAALAGFVKSLPHPVECIIGLSEDPLKIYRHMCVDIPVKDMGPAVLIEDK